jgi:hypothetical protein
VCRWGEDTEWLIHFDVDEFLIPMGKHRDLKSMLKGYEGTDVAVLTVPMDYYGHCDEVKKEDGEHLLYLDWMKCRGNPGPAHKSKEFIRPARCAIALWVADGQCPCVLKSAACV